MLDFLFINWLSVLGILIGVIGIAIAVFVYYKQKPKRKIEIRAIEGYNLFSQKSRKEGISILHKGKEIEGSLTLFKIGLKNNTHTDIDGKDLKKDFLIKLPEDYTFENIDIPNNEEIKCIPEIRADERNIVKLSWDLLKKEEEIVLDFLISSSDSLYYNVYDKLSFEYRIKNIDDSPHKVLLKPRKSFINRLINVYLVVGLISTLFLLTYNYSIIDRVNIFSYELSEKDNSDIYYLDYILFQKNNKSAFDSIKTILNEDNSIRNNYDVIEKRGKNYNIRNDEVVLSMKVLIGGLILIIILVCLRRFIDRRKRPNQKN